MTRRRCIFELIVTVLSARWFSFSPKHLRQLLFVFNLVLIFQLRWSLLKGLIPCTLQFIVWSFVTSVGLFVVVNFFYFHLCLSACPCQWHLFPGVLLVPPDCLCWLQSDRCHLQTSILIDSTKPYMAFSTMSSRNKDWPVVFIFPRWPRTRNQLPVSVEYLPW